jgi:curved DNA-binding protein CbpA
MHKCLCGTAIDDEHALCTRCGSLHELGLSTGASLDEVKAAHKMLVKVWYPDRFQSDPKLAKTVETKLKAINAAFLFLTSEDNAEESNAGDGRASGANQRSGLGAAQERTTRAEASKATRARRRANERVSPRGRTWKGGFGRRLAVRLLVLGVVLGIWALFMKVADSALADDPTTGRFYTGYKSKLKSDFEAAAQRTWGDFDQRFHSMFGGKPQTAPTVAPPVSDAANSAVSATSADVDKHLAQRTAAGPIRLLPIVTVGLTRDEVIAAQGPPTSASEGKLMYENSELDLKDGKVVGWKIDPRSTLRVKLWPEGPVDTSLRFFTVGSTKDEVLVVEGTPTSFSQDRFEYGRSVVYFRDGRVAAWKNGEGSVMLRAVQ